LRAFSLAEDSSPRKVRVPDRSDVDRSAEFSILS